MILRSRSLTVLTLVIFGWIGVWSCSNKQVAPSDETVPLAGEALAGENVAAGESLPSVPGPPPDGAEVPTKVGSGEESPSAKPTPASADASQIGTAATKSPDKNNTGNTATPAVAQPAFAPAPASQIKVARSSFSGCLKTGKPTADGTPQKRSRGTGINPLTPPKQKGVEITNGNNMVVNVEHFFTHLCSLKAKVDTKISANEVRITETLSGAASRCVCESTIVTKVPIPKAGAYTFFVDLVDRGNSKNVYKEKRTVRDPR